MEEQTIKILEECSAGCKMAVESMNQVSEYVKEEGLQQAIDKACEKHKKLEGRAAQALTEHARPEKEPGKMAEAFSWLTTEVKMKLNDDSRQAAKLMMNGCNMGIQSIMEVINTNPDADKESIDLARDLVKAEEEFMADLRPFL